MKSLLKFRLLYSFSRLALVSGVSKLIIFTSALSISMTFGSISAVFINFGKVG